MLATLDSTRAFMRFLAIRRRSFALSLLSCPFSSSPFFSSCGADFHCECSAASEGLECLVTAATAPGSEPIQRSTTKRTNKYTQYSYNMGKTPTRDTRHTIQDNTRNRKLLSKGTVAHSSHKTDQVQCVSHTQSTIKVRTTA